MTTTGRERATDIDAIVATMVERLAEHFEPGRIFLFGSRARGDAKAGSDMGLLVVMPDGTGQHKSAVAMHLLLGDLPLSRDNVGTTPGHIAQRGHLIGTVPGPALRECRLLYE